MMTSVHGFFNMLTETDMERYRAETFLTKEPETIVWINDMKPGEVLYDVGANVGVYTLYAASRGVKVVAIEPVLENYVRLVRNIEANGFERLVAPIYGAIGGSPWDDDEYKLIDLSIYNNEYGASGSQTGKSDGKIVRKVPLLSLACIDSILDEPDYIKVDVDGAEYEAMTSMYNGPSKSCLVEINPPVTIEDMLGILFDKFTTDNKYNTMTPHSRERRQREGIAAENVIFTRR